MFRRFIDLSLSEAVPDHSTIWRFRQLLNTENLLEALLEQINGYILFICLMVFNATFNNISIISWRSVLLVEETGVPRENN
jgi:hypothetical protein